jgi:hypothetical protein
MQRPFGLRFCTDCMGLGNGLPDLATFSAQEPRIAPEVDQPVPDGISPDSCDCIRLCRQRKLAPLGNKSSPILDFQFQAL